jgi:hypothetical protein
MTVTAQKGGIMPATYEDIYREVVQHPVPREGLVLPHDILRRRLSTEDGPQTQQDRLVRAFYEFITAAWISGGQTLSQRHKENK